MRVTQWRPPRCQSGKAAFRSQGAALRALEVIAMDQAQAVVPTNTAPKRAYRCECGAWHLTKSVRGGVAVKT